MGLTVGLTEGWTEDWTVGWTEGWTEDWTEDWTEGWTEGWTKGSSVFKSLGLMELLTRSVAVGSAEGLTEVGGLTAFNDSGLFSTQLTVGSMVAVG